MIKVGIDASPLQTGHSVRGIGTYTKNLSEFLKEVTKNPEYREFRIEFLNQQPTISNQQFDVIHYPYFDLFFHTLPLSKVVPTIVTIHDTIPLVFPKHYPSGIKGKIRFYLQKCSLRSVKAVITDSLSSKRDIIHYLGYPSEKIHVIYLAPSKAMQKLGNNGWRKAIKSRYNLPEKFVLYVGDVNWNKNVLGLVRACKKIQTSVVIVGKQAAEESFDKGHLENQARRQLLKEYGKDQGVLRIGFVPEQDLVKIYNLASVYCQPSFYEGFGLPALEAMACGCPVVAANNSSLPEICGEAALFFDPSDTTDMGEKISEFLNDRGIREIYTKKGLLQADKFTWEKTARATLEVYEKVVSA